MFFSSSRRVILDRISYFTVSQCDQMWRNLATLVKFKKSLTKFFRVYLVFGKILQLLWQKCNAIGQVCTVTDGEIFKDNLAIWSHCSTDNTYSRGRIHVQLTSCLTGLDSVTLLMFKLATDLSVCSNPNQGNRRSAVQWYFPWFSLPCLDAFFVWSGLS